MMAAGALEEQRARQPGTGTEDHTYRGVPFQVTYFSGTSIHGTGWSFRYVNGVPYFAQGSTDWAGGFASKADAIASAQYTVDLQGQLPPGTV